MNIGEIEGVLALEDGRIFKGSSFGATGCRSGEVVFNTGMTGYQEVLTDPSYSGQIVTMTYPLIGNYGANAADAESDGPSAEGLLTREYCPYPSNYESESSLGEYLTENGVIALCDIDTRALTRHIREAGAMRAVIAAGQYDAEELVKQASASPHLSELDLVREVSSPHCYELDRPAGFENDKKFVVLYDFGVKRSILRCLNERGCRIRVVPAATSANDVLEMAPDGILLSNGPGDPAAAEYAVKEIRKLIGKKPILGICLGHQLLSLALGGSTYKLKFGHHGSNHPVKELATGKIDITCQNHGFCVDIDSLQGVDIEVTHLNMNDKTVEGIRHRSLPIMCVQHHPEAGPGPHDARRLFDTFKSMMDA